jgi:hypothetical protein
MRYLAKRDDFLRKAKISENKSDFLRQTTLGNELYDELIREDYATNHGSGPFQNDIGWHDSLVGRLINHMIRKAKVRYNLVKIKMVISRLNDEFDRLKAESVVNSMTDEDKKLYVRALLSQFFEALKEAIEKGYKVEVIKNLTEDAIKQVEGLKSEDIEESVRKRLIGELEELLKFLEQFDENEGEEDPEMSEEDEDEDEGEGDESAEDDGVLEPEQAEKLTPSYPTMISSLNALYGILITYKSTVKQDSKNKPAYKIVPGDTLAKIQQNPAINKKKLDIPTIKKKNPATANIGENEELIKKGIKELVLESASINEDRAVSKEKIKTAEQNQMIAGGRTATVVGKGEDHATQALGKLNKAIESLISDDKGVAVTADFLKALIDNSKNTDSKNLIKSLFNEINVCLKGDRKATIQEPDKLYVEAYEYLKPRTAENKKGGKLPVVAEKIARFSKRAMQFDGENLYGTMGELGKHLQKFVESMKSNIKADIVEDRPKVVERDKKEAEKPKEESTQERASIGRYEDFIRLIKEADEDDAAASDPRTGSTAEKIQDFFNKKCMTVKDYTMETAEFEKVMKNMDRLAKEKNAIVIDGMDPVIEIMKLFNRAYKLYMSDFISKRSNFQDGKGGVGVGTMSEYTKIGDAYRNKKIFDQWESAVSDILKNRKYQQIFSPATKLRVGDEMREKAGANLRKFMTDLLDGDKLYGGEGGATGAQSTLLNKYFGDPDEAAKNAEKNGFAIGEDGKENQKNAKEVMESAVRLKLEKIDSQGLQAGTFFTIKGKNKEGNDIQRTFFVQSVENGTAYLQYSKDFFTFNRYLSKLDGKRILEDGQYKLNYQNANAEVKYTKVKADSSILLKPGKVNIASYGAEEKTIREEEITIESVYWLSTKNEREKMEAYSIPKDQSENLMKAIASCGQVKNVTNYLSGVEKVKVTKV